MTYENIAVRGVGELHPRDTVLVPSRTSQGSESMTIPRVIEAVDFKPMGSGENGTYIVTYREIHGLASVFHYRPSTRLFRVWPGL